LESGVFCNALVGKRGVTAHPLAALLPPLPLQEFEALKENIALLGLLHPIVVNERGEILDGIHRWRACRQLGIEPSTVPFASLMGSNGERPPVSEVEFIFSANVNRRHLTNDQRTALYTAFLPEIQTASRLRLIEGCKKGGEATARLRLPGNHTEAEEKSNSLGATFEMGESPGKLRDRNLTRTRFKEVAGVGARKAARAIRLFNADPRLLEPVIQGKETLLEATRRFETAGFPANVGSPIKTKCRAKPQKRLLSTDELWIRVERWNDFHIGRLLRGINPTQHRDVLLQVGTYCYDLIDKV
jgi:hypothetical protein